MQVIGMKKFLTPLAVLVIAAAVSAAWYFIITEMYKDWQPAAGTVTDVEITRRLKHPGSWIRYAWTYRVDGIEYSGQDRFIYSEKSGYHEGDEKEIWYDPDDPSDSQFYKPSPGLYVCAPFIFAVPFMLAAYHLQAKKESRGLHR